MLKPVHPGGPDARRLLPSVARPPAGATLAPRWLLPSSSVIPDR